MLTNLIEGKKSEPFCWYSLPRWRCCRPLGARSRQLPSSAGMNFSKHLEGDAQKTRRIFTEPRITKIYQDPSIQNWLMRKNLQPYCTRSRRGQLCDFTGSMRRHAKATSVGKPAQDHHLHLSRNFDETSCGAGWRGRRGRNHWKDESLTAPSIAASCSAELGLYLKSLKRSQQMYLHGCEWISSPYIFPMNSLWIIINGYLGCANHWSWEAQRINQNYLHRCCPQAAATTRSPGADPKLPRRPHPVSCLYN